MRQPVVTILAGLIICNFIACNGSQQAETEKTTASMKQIEKAAWLIGDWGNAHNETKLTEIWKKENDKLFIGRSFNLRNNDTVSSEWIRLEQQGDSVYYIPNVKNQNKGEVVKFVMTTATDRELIFENPAHDFPQKITYQLVNKDSINAEISGGSNGEWIVEKFPMHRIH